MLLLGLASAFAVAANGAHDYWAATIVYLSMLALATGLWLRRSWPADGPGVSTVFAVPVAVVIVASTASHLGASRPADSWFSLMDWLAALAAFLAASHLFREEAPLDRFLKGAVVVVWAETAVIFYQHLPYALAADAPRGAAAALRYFVSLQVPGTLVNSSAATAFLLLWAPVFGGLWLAARRESRDGRVWAAGFAGAVLGILLLDSNWGMVCLAATAPLLAGPRRFLAEIRRRPRAAAALAATGAVAFAILLAWKFGHTRNMNGQPLPPGETTRRFYWWLSGLAMFRDHPLLGVGLGNFGAAFPAYKIGAVQNTLYPHNLAVGFLAEGGMAAFGAVGHLLIRVLAPSASRETVLERRWPFLLGLAAFATFGLIGLGAEYLANLLLCGVFLGVLAAPASTPNWKARRSILLVGAAAAFCAIPPLIFPFLASRSVVEGRALLAAGRPAEAAKEFMSAMGLDPRSAEAAGGWADALTAIGDPANSGAGLALRRRAVELDRLNGKAWFELGRDQLRAGDLAAGRLSLERAAALGFRPPEPR